MPILEPHHDLAHPVEGDDAWSESYYFNCYDPHTDCGFFTRIGVRPNELTVDSHMAVWLPSGDVAHLKFEKAQETMIDRRLDVGPICYEMAEPMELWGVSAAGTALVQKLDGSGGIDQAEIAVDVMFRALTPPIGVDGQGADAARSSGSSSETGVTVGKGHFEQAGRWTGWIEIDGVRIDLIEARGNRDKSWGPRRWEGPTMWRWFSINVGGEAFGDGIHLGGIRIGAAGAPDLHRGWVWRNSRHASVREWEVSTETRADGWTQEVVHLSVLDSDGESTHLRGDLLRVAPLPRKHGTHFTVVNEGLTRWTLLPSPSRPGQDPPDDLGVGYGIAEYLHQMGADALPVIPVE